MTAPAPLPLTDIDDDDLRTYAHNWLAGCPDAVDPRIAQVTLHLLNTVATLRESLTAAEASKASAHEALRAAERRELEALADLDEHAAALRQAQADLVDERARTVAVGEELIEARDTITSLRAALAEETKRAEASLDMLVQATNAEIDTLEQVRQAQAERDAARDAANAYVAVRGPHRSAAAKAAWEEVCRVLWPSFARSPTPTPTPDAEEADRG